MSTARKATRDDSARQSLVDYPDESIHHGSSVSNGGTKRLFSNRVEPEDNNGENRAELLDAAAADEEFPAGKRHRSSDWPLRNTSPAMAQSALRAPLRSRNAPNSPSLRRPSSAQARSSKFVEGSMNDRASQKPPSTYLDAEEHLRERYERDQQGDGGCSKSGQHRNSSHHPNMSTTEPSIGDRSELSRRSGIFRFGKSLASSFNPNKWKIWSKQQLPQGEETTQQRALRDRQVKAERTYKELKRSGHFRDAAIGQPIPPGSSDSNAELSRHDSGVAFSTQRASSRMSREMTMEEKRMGRVFLDPPHLTASHGVETPTSKTSAPAAPSGASSPRKQAFYFKKPSLSNTKNAESKELPSNGPDTGDRQVRKIPSRKDLQKQQRLVKRVSDLEGKLEAARRELSEAIGEPVRPQSAMSARPRFVPGALPSLPSERLLSGYISSDAGCSDNDTFNGIGRALTTDDIPRPSQPAMSSAIVDPSQSDAGSYHSTASPLRADKPLQHPEVPLQERLIQSVESDTPQEVPVPNTDMAHQAKAPEHIAVTRQAPVQTSQISPRKNEELVSVRGNAKPQPSNRPSKKRKSAFGGLGDDSGRYEPPSDSEAAESDLIKGRPQMKEGWVGRPRKVQKIVQEAALEEIPSENIPPSTPEANGASSPQNQRQPAPRYRGPSKKAALPAPVAPPTRKLTKTRTSRSGQQLTSPPPPSASTFTGPDLVKPTLWPVSKADQQTDEPAHDSVPTTTQSHMPPVPKMPKAIRLPSGEVIRTGSVSTSASAAASASTSESSKLTKPRPVKPVERRDSKRDDGGKERARKRPRKKEHFEWPDDIF